MSSYGFQTFRRPADLTLQASLSSAARGLIAKDEASQYVRGRTTRWLKVKQKDWTVEEDRWRRTISVTRSRGPKTK